MSDSYIDGTERIAVDCPSCRMQRYADVDCHHCGNSAVSCLKGIIQDQRAEIERLKKALILKELPDYSYREELRTAAIVEQQAELEQARIQLAAHDKQNNCAEKVRK